MIAPSVPWPPMPWPRLLAAVLLAVAEFLPAAAAGGDRRTWYTPAGDMALVWAVFGVCDVVSLALLFNGAVPRIAIVTAIVTLVNAALLAPAVLRFADARLARRRWWWAAGLTVLSALPMLWLGFRRTYLLAVRPPQGVVLLVLGGVAFASVVRRTRGRLRDSAAAWICGALLVYLVDGVVWRPLLEVGSGYGVKFVRGMTIGRLLVESAIGVAIARGVRLERMRGAAAAPIG